MQNSSAFQYLAIDTIHESTTNPRRSFDESKLQELAESIKHHGLIQPITVRPNSEGFALLAGARRYRAALLAELFSIPAHIVEIDDAQVLEWQLIELPARRCSAYSAFLLRPRAQAEADTANAQVGSPLLKITSTLTPPYRAYRAYFPETESPIAGPARFPDLVRLVRTFLHRVGTANFPSTDIQLFQTTVYLMSAGMKSLSAALNCWLRRGSSALLKAPRCEPLLAPSR
jgi:ParB-like nuclease domain